MKQTEEQSVKIKELRSSWKLLSISLTLVRENFGPLFILVAIPSLLGFIGSTTDNRVMSYLNENSVEQLPLLIAGIALSLINQGPLMLYAIRKSQAKSISLSEAYGQGIVHTWKIIGFELFVGLIVVAGLLLLIVPGIIAAYILIQRYYLAPYYIVGKSLSIREAMSMSRRETANYSGQIWGVAGVSALLTLFGALVSAETEPAGLLITIVGSMLVTFLPALRYVEIRGKLPQSVTD